MTASHGGLQGLVEQLLATLRHDREMAQIAVQTTLLSRRAQQKHAEVRLQRLYAEYQADWNKANELPAGTYCGAPKNYGE